MVFSMGLCATVATWPTIWVAFPVMTLGSVLWAILSADPVQLLKA